MKLFLDTEFTDFQGELISLALVDENDSYFYTVVKHSEPSKWVKENVIHVLGTTIIVAKTEAQLALQAFLMQYKEIEVIADWPEDIAHFCDLLITAPGLRINTPDLTLRVIRKLSSKDSLVPHNALEDARAIKLDYERKI